MNEDQFLQVCRACDSLLLAPEATPVTLANPWLHVIRAHPMFLGQYSMLFGGRSEVNRWLHASRNFASRLRARYRALGTRDVLWHESTSLPDKADVLIVSHVVNIAQTEVLDDFYFGSVPEDLARSGKRVVVATINYTLHPSAGLASRWCRGNAWRVVLGQSLSARDERRLATLAKNEARRLHKYSLRADLDAFTRGVARQAAAEATGGAMLHALRVAEQIRRLVAALAPTTLVTTYEGHSWERAVYGVARTESDGIRCIGYQHATALPYQHAARRSLGRMLDPEIILTAGPLSAEILARAEPPPAIRIDCLGSSRALLTEISSQQAATGAARRCIVLPEGDAGECRILFNFSLACARLRPDIEFVWRLHPNFGHTALERIDPAFRTLPPNISFSKGTLGDDASRCGWVLYRGSTAALQAAAYGAIPLYLARPDEISIDVLMDVVDVTHHVIVEPAALIQILEDTADDQRRAWALEFAAACARVLSPLEPARLLALLEPGNPIQECSPEST